MLATNLRRDRLPDGRFELSLDVRLADAAASSRIWIRVPATFGDPAADDASPFVPGLLPLCMRRGEDLEVRAPVSARLLRSVEQAQDVLWSFWPDMLRPVAVQAPARALATGPPATVSSFTRGMDSWYTILTADSDGDDRPKLSHLIYVPSADIWDAERAERDRHAVAAAAEPVGLPVLAAETNLRELAEPILGWDEYHGAFLAACGLALGPSHFLMPSGTGGGEILPAGTHPLLDPLWSTERTTIVHHGDVTRPTKAKVIASSPAALATLRVCWQVAGNCGRCSKCLHTMAALELAGALRDCATFPDEIDPRVMAAAESHPAGRRRWELVASRYSDEPEERAKRLAAELVALRSRAAELADECDALERRLEDRKAVSRVVPGLAAELRRAVARGSGLAARLGDELTRDARQ